jgi:L-aspartate oxidase
VVGALREAGLDPTRDLVPVAPAAHYTIGGIVTDLHARSAVAGLYAVGETACTGLHGANRLASNSLSECFVFGRRAALAALEEPALNEASAEPGQAEIDAGASAPPMGADLDWRSELSPSDQRDIRLALWQHAGIERSADGLSELLDSPHPLARLIARSALMRKESRGTHTRSDYLECDTRLDGKHAVVQSGDELELDWQDWR